MICDRIKSLREAHRLTQAELARKLKLTRSSINAWELGISVPSTQYIIELTYLFDTSADYLLEIDSKETIDIGNLSKEKKEALYNLLDILKK